jgi:inner membrane protein
MATLGHVAVGIAAGRLFTAASSPPSRLAVTMVALSAVSLAPDLDVVAFKLGIPYDATWGHRGAAHSVGFAALVGAVAVAVAAPLPSWRE